MKKSIIDGKCLLGLSLFLIILLCIAATLDTNIIEGNTPSSPSDSSDASKTPEKESSKLREDAVNTADNVKTELTGAFNQGKSFFSINKKSASPTTTTLAKTSKDIPEEIPKDKVQGLV